MGRFTEFMTRAGNVIVLFKKVGKCIFEYWRKPVSEEVRLIGTNISVSGTKIKRIVIASMLSAIAAIMQSAGAIGGPGFIISSLVTLPVAVAAILSIPSGLAAYSVTLLLLVILQPSEMIIFPFTTGLSGLGIGLAFKLFKKKAAVTAFAALSLASGISFLLYIPRFPVLGPASPQKFGFITSAAIYAFSYLYSWLCSEICMIALRFLNRAIVGSQ